jgi:hypothetical protein
MQELPVVQPISLNNSSGFSGGNAWNREALSRAALMRLRGGGMTA